jgi:hypothetical protein
MPDTLILTDRGRPWGDEALGWVTLVRLLGWSATVGDRYADVHRGLRPDVVIVTGRPERLPARSLQMLHDSLHTGPLLVVAAAGTPDGDWGRLAGAAERPGQQEATGVAGCLTWCGPGPPAAWRLAAGLHTTPMSTQPDTEVWAALDRLPLIVARSVGLGSVIATVAFDIARARRLTGAATALVKRVLTCGCPFPTAWLDLAGALVLRMDDPGSSANVHLRSWSYSKLGEPEWDQLGADLRARGARLSVGYTPGWVDDGDAERGTLEVNGDPVAREPGAIHPSPLVRYVDRTANCPGCVSDYRAEFRGVSRLEAAGLVGVEPHGYTHMAGDLGAWARAADRYDNVSWYREFTPAADRAAAGRSHPAELGAVLIRRYFRHAPTTLVCPGQASTETTVAHALRAGLRLVSADRLALRHDQRFCWCAGVAVEYLDKPDASTLESELPAIGYFHDYELATIGLEWMGAQLDAWRRAGARRFIDLRELAAALSLRLDLAPDGIGGWRLTADADPDLPLPRPLPVMLRANIGELPLEVGRSGRPGRLRVQRLGEGLGRVVLSADERVTAASARVHAAHA